MECKSDNKESYYWDGFKKEWMECTTDNDESYYSDGFRKE